MLAVCVRVCERERERERSGEKRLSALLGKVGAVFLSQMLEAIPGFCMQSSPGPRRGVLVGETCLLSLAGTHLPDPLQLHLYCSLSGRDDREGDGGSVLLWGSLVPGTGGGARGWRD